MKLKNKILSITTEDTSERNVIHISEVEMKNFIWQQLQIGHLSGDISSLLRDAECDLNELTGFGSASFFRSEMKTFQFLDIMY